MKLLNFALAVTASLFFSVLAFADVSCICGASHKFTAPNYYTALSYCAKGTPRGQKVNLHSCVQAPKGGFGFDVNNCSPQISCGACGPGYSGEFVNQSCTVVNCDGSQSSFSQQCQVQ